MTTYTGVLAEINALSKPERKKTMPLFTPYMNRLEECPPILLKNIGIALRSMMKKGGLWYLPPQYLGYSGETWNQKWADDEDRDFEDLVCQCYMEAIFRCRKSLLEQVAKGRDIDNMVFQYIKWFLNKRQAQFEPVGKAVYENVNAATQELVDIGMMEIRPQQRMNWKTKFDKSTLLAFHSSQSAILASKVEILTALHRIPEWKMSFQLELRYQDKKTLEPLCVIFCQLRELGIEYFQYGEFISVVQTEVGIQTISLNSISDKDDDANGEPLAILNDPALTVESEELDFGLLADIFQEFGEFCNKMRTEIDNTVRRKDVRCILHQVLTELEESLLEEATEPQIKLPSQGELAKRLGISAGAVNDKIKKLRQLAEQVTKLNDWEPTVLSLIERMLPSSK